jgi:hypothetical protein
MGKVEDNVRDLHPIVTHDDPPDGVPELAVITGTTKISTVQLRCASSTNMGQAIFKSGLKRHRDFEPYLVY